MADRFDKFTERARRVLTLAQEEAQRFNHNYIGTEHLLLGLVREGDGIAAKVLNNLGVELKQGPFRSRVHHWPGRPQTPSGEIGLTPRAKKVIELAVDEARRLNHSLHRYRAPAARPRPRGRRHRCGRPRSARGQPGARTQAKRRASCTDAAAGQQRQLRSAASRGRPRSTSSAST